MAAATGLATVVMFGCVLVIAEGRAEVVQASRIIDRTLSCTVASRAGVQKTKLSGTSGTRLDASKWLHLANVSVRDVQGTFVGVDAGNPLAPDQTSGYVFGPQRLWLRADAACRSAAPIALSRQGLVGGRAAQLGDDYECAGRGRITVRVRAEFRAPTKLVRYRGANEQIYLRASGTVKRATLAVRSAAGKPLAYGEVSESGRALLYASPGCVLD